MNTNPAAMDAALAARVELMHALAAEAGAIAMKWYQRADLPVEIKADASPVTIADKEIETHLRARIAAAFTGDGLIGEEFGSAPGASEFTWVIDPIDGTVSFAAGVPLFGVLIGLERRSDGHTSRNVAGIAHFPALCETIWAVDGHGAHWQREGRAAGPAPTAARVGTCTSLRDALVCTTGMEYYDQSGRRPVFDVLARSCRKLRGWSDCYGLLLAATGRIDAMIDPVMKPWDCGPFPVIFREAGGVFCSWAGDESIHAPDSVAGNREIVAELRGLVARA